MLLLLLWSLLLLRYVIMYCMSTYTYTHTGTTYSIVRYWFFITMIMDILSEDKHYDYVQNVIFISWYSLLLSCFRCCLYCYIITSDYAILLSHHIKYHHRLVCNILYDYDINIRITEYVQYIILYNIRSNTHNNSGTYTCIYEYGCSCCGWKNSRLTLAKT